MDKSTSNKIVDFIDNRIGTLDDPRTIAKQLKGKLGSYWSYRIGDYRIICDLQNDELIILIVDLGHRKFIYKKN